MNQSRNIATSLILLVGSLVITASTSRGAPQVLPTVHDVQGRFIAALGGQDSWLDMLFTDGTQQILAGSARRRFKSSTIIASSTGC
jgi:hypothetical protein